MSDYHVTQFARLYHLLADQVDKHQFLNAITITNKMNLMLIQALSASLKGYLEGWDHLPSWKRPYEP